MGRNHLTGDLFPPINKRIEQVNVFYEKTVKLMNLEKGTELDYDGRAEEGEGKRRKVYDVLVQEVLSSD